MTTSDEIIDESTTAPFFVSQLQKRMAKLGDAASKESLQALAKWIGFRRNFIQEFSKALVEAVADPNQLALTYATSPGTATANDTNKAARQWVYLQILHEAIILDSGTSRWDRFAEMREYLGEYCMVEIAKKKCLDAATIKKVEGCVKQWDAVSAFGGPTLINLIKKQLTAAAAAPSSSSSPKAAVDAATTPSSPKRSTTPTSPKRSKTPPPPTSKSPTPSKSSSPKRERDASPPKPATEKEETASPAEAAVAATPPPKQEQPKEETPTSPEHKKKVVATPESTSKPKKRIEYDFESKVSYCVFHLILFVFSKLVGLFLRKFVD